MSYDEGSRSSGTSTVVVVLAIIGGVVLGIVVVCGGVAYFAIQKMAPVINAAVQSGQEFQKSIQTAVAFLDDIHANRLDQAYQMTSEDFQAHTSQKELEELVRKYPAFREGSGLKKDDLRPDLTDFAKVSDEPNQVQIPDFRRVTYLCPLTGPDGESLEVNLTVAKEGESFKVDQFAVEKPRPKTRPTVRIKTSKQTRKAPASEKKDMDKAGE